jgi:hypothetical protein
MAPTVRLAAASASAAALFVFATTLPSFASARIPNEVMGARHQRIPGAVDPADAFIRARATPGLANCTQAWFTQTTDHFSWSAPPTGSFTFQQRYCTYDAYWNKGAGGAIWMYLGNESPYDLYVNHTGLMWENAQKAGALLLW